MKQIKPLGEITPEQAQIILDLFIQDHLDCTLNFYQECRAAMLQYKTNKAKYEADSSGPLSAALYDVQKAFQRAEELAVPDFGADEADHQFHYNRERSAS